MSEYDEIVLVCDHKGLLSAPETVIGRFRRAGESERKMPGIGRWLTTATRSRRSRVRGRGMNATRDNYQGFVHVPLSQPENGWRELGEGMMRLRCEAEGCQVEQEVAPRNLERLLAQMAASEARRIQLNVLSEYVHLAKRSG